MVIIVVFAVVKHMSAEVKWRGWSSASFRCIRSSHCFFCCEQSSSLIPGNDAIIIICCVSSQVRLAAGCISIGSSSKSGNNDDEIGDQIGKDLLTHLRW